MSLLSSWESRRGCCRSGKSSFCKYAAHLLRCYAKINPQRIRSGTDATGSKLQQVFRQKNLSLDSVHGSTLSNMPAVNFCSRLVSVPPICKSAGKAGHLLRCIIKSVHPCTLLMAKGLSKNFSFWTVSLGFFAMSKIKSLMYKNLIFNSRGCRKSNQFLRHPLVVEQLYTDI